TGRGKIGRSVAEGGGGWGGVGVGGGFYFQLPGPSYANRWVKNVGMWQKRRHAGRLGTRAPPCLKEWSTR
ncbi:hypothetical protein IscW_ISCW001937, partial [Ixodes scapularis]